MPDPRRMAIYFGSFIGPLSGNAVLALVPSLMQEFEATAPEVILSISFFMLPFALFMLFSGTWSDMMGRRRVISLGFAVYALGSVFTGMSTDLYTFYLARTVTGFGFAFVQPVLMALLGDIVPVHERGKAMGYLGAATTAGIAMGPFLAGFMSSIDWRLTFLVIAALSLVAWAFVMLQCMETRQLSKGADMRAFARLLVKSARDRGMATLALTGFLTFLCYIGTQSFLSAVLSEPPLQLAEEDIGVVLASAGLAGIIAAPVGGFMVDRFGSWSTAVLGYLAMATAFALMTMATSMLQYIGVLVVLGAGSALVWAALLSLTVVVLPGSKGTASSIFNSARFFGYAAASPLFTVLFVSSGFDAVNIASALVAFLAIGSLFLTVRSMRGRCPTPPAR